MPTLISRRCVVLFKQEAVEGVGETPSPTTDAVLVEYPLRITFNPNIIDTTEVTASLDPFDPIVGGMSVTIEFDIYLKGSGVISVEPEWAPMLKACGFLAVNGSVIASEALAGGGTTTTAVLGATAVGTAQLYRGRPIIFAGAVGALTSTIWDYTAGKVASITNTASIPLDATSTYTLPRSWFYRPTSTAIPSGTMWIYTDGLLYQFVGCRGTCPLTLTSGGPGKLSFRFQGMFSSKTDAALPVATYDTTRPPVWKEGSLTINSVIAAGQALSVDPGNNLVMPDNPNASEGFDPAIITARQVRGSISPKETLVATRNTMLAFRSSTKQPLQAWFGLVAGNRIGITIPSALYLNQGPIDSNGYQVIEVPFHATGQDSGYMIAQF